MKRPHSPFRHMQRLTELVKQTEETQQHQRLELLLRGIARLQESGNALYRMAAGSVFMYSLTSWLDFHNHLRAEVLALMPASLKEEYFATLTVCDL